ncbi:RagB/SusD family nutrient uptake outer membrane protein [Bacteroidota bacterium]
MKKIKYFTYILSALLLMSCAEDFLEKKNLYEQSDESYYSSSVDIAEALAAAYASLPIDAGNNNPFIVSELMSDDCFGGGGINDDGFHGTDAFTLPPDMDYYMDLYETTYEGILRVNMILKRFDQAEYDDENARKQDLGEIHFLRAYFYFRLAKFFGAVPLKTDPAPANLPKATPEQLFGQIASDLKQAIELMPATRYNPAAQADRLGHATKWAAEALMARVFLYYTGYYEQSSLPLVDGGSISSSQVIGWIDDCVASSGHELVSDFRNIWPYSYADGYPYVDNNGLEWIGDGEANVNGEYNLETIFAINYSVYGGWNLPDKLSYSNQHSLYVGLREQSHLPFGQGWGGGPVNPQLWDSFEDGDVRQQGSILNVNDATLDEGDVLTNFLWGGDNQMHETGYWQKKYMPIYIVDPASTTGGLAGLFYVLYGGENNMQLWNMQDDILIRFADVLLMGAELGSANAQNYLDRIRTRAGLGSVPVTLDNIKRERRHELAFEGLRYFDLLRWHDAEEAFAVATNIPVKNVNVDDTYTVTFRPETGGFLPIPHSEILLSNGVLEQTPGWE